MRFLVTILNTDPLTGSAGDVNRISSVSRFVNWDVLPRAGETIFPFLSVYNRYKVSSVEHCLSRGYIEILCEEDTQVVLMGSLANEKDHWIVLTEANQYTFNAEIKKFL